MRRESNFMDKRRARVIAFYLPQYHPIPENDAWWGNGFTEWTNVAKARPLFRRHYQPRLPADLGFYDLRVPETRAAQAEMARNYGVEAFCYWHYWFAGKRLLERPFQEVLTSGEPDFPFCLGWANQSWTGIWHGCPERKLIEQTYPGEEDYAKHFQAILPALSDERYLTVNGRNLFIVFSPTELPEPIRFTDYWRELARRAGLKGFHFVGVADHDWSPRKHGFDGSILHEPINLVRRIPGGLMGLAAGLYWRFLRRDLMELKSEVFRVPRVYDYRDVVRHAFSGEPALGPYTYPCVVPNWDNTPRSGVRGFVFQDSSPSLFGVHLREAIALTAGRDPDDQLVFLKSWNEWAEGNYVEPDRLHGDGYLRVIKQETA
jgi:hypothetical protein